MYKHLTPFELYYIWKHCVNKSALEMFSERLKVIKVAKDLDCHRSTMYKAVKHIKVKVWEQPIGTFISTKFKKLESNKLKKLLLR